jgi:hypothetical protein
MLDTMMTHSSKSAKDNQEESNTLYQILKFGTKKLFGQSPEELMDNVAYIIDEQKLYSLLDREAQFRELDE